MNKVIIFILFSFSIFSQTKIEIISETKGMSIRGLSVVSDRLFWVSGANGMVGKSINGGENIAWFQVKGFEKADFRDIEAFDENTAIIMAIAEPTYILKTIDGGNTWKIVFENHVKGMFLDAMDFKNSNEGMVVGDAVDGKIFIAKTVDSGNTWLEIEKRPIAIGAEGCFASSGTNILFRKKDYYFVTGGLNSRFFKNETPKVIPIIQGKESTGANSISISANGKKIIIVGGDFNKKDEMFDHCLISKNGGKSFIKSIEGPFGYRSCVTFISKNKAISCGLSGVDITSNSGLNWLNISKESFHVCGISKKGKIIYFAGANGRIGKLVL
jgi:hypothetical protein